MDQIPFGSALLALFLNLVLQLTFRVLLPKVWLRLGVYFSSVAIFSALAISVSNIFSINNNVSAFSTALPLNEIFSVFSLMVIFISHVNFLLLEKKRDADLLFFEGLAAFLSLALISAENIMVIALCFPLAILLIAAVPLVFNKLIGIRSITKGLIYSMIVFFLWVGIASYFLYQTGSLQLKELNQFFMQSSEGGRIAFFGWLMGIASFWVLIFPPPFNFFDREYEATVTWPVFSMFRWPFAQLGFFLPLKWTYGLAAVQNESGYQWLNLNGQGYNEIYFLINLLLLFWLALVALKSQRLHRFWSCVLSVPLLMGGFAILNGDLSGFSWAAVSFFIFVLGVSLVSSMMPLSGLTVSVSIREVWRKIQWNYFPGGWIFLLVAGLLVPAGNHVYFQTIKSLFYPWVYEKQHSYWFIAIGVACALLTVATANAMHKMLRGFAQPEVLALQINEKNTGSSERLIWHYILLIPFIFLGIYPFPLYNYVKFALTSFF